LPAFEREGLSRVSKFVAFLKDDTGATAIEYGLVAAGISLAIIVVVNAIGTTLSGNFDSIAHPVKAPTCLGKFVCS
jgi:pilus assembly protein Flp/PilA